MDAAGAVLTKLHCGIGVNDDLSTVLFTLAHLCVALYIVL